MMRFLPPSSDGKQTTKLMEKTGMADVSGPGEPDVAPPSEIEQLQLVADLFHRINRVLPANQKLLSLPPGMPAREAVALLAEHGFSQAPVAVQGKVLGMFTLRSFSQKAATCTLAELAKQREAPGDFLVEECMEQFELAPITAEIAQVFPALERSNGVLVGSPERLYGLLTPMDFFTYLHQLAQPFILLSEIELTLRMLIRRVVPQIQLEGMAKRSLANLYAADRIPLTLEAMTFENYRTIVSDGRNWDVFSHVLGRNRFRASSYLEEVAQLRNDVFHFKREITSEDLESLLTHRDWLLTRAQIAESNGQAEEGNT